MKNFHTLLLSLVCIVLVACEKTGERTPPITSQVSSSITNYHPSFWEGLNPPFESNLVVSVEFRVTDPDGLTDINKVEVVDVTNDVTYKLVERLSNDSFGNFYSLAQNVFNPSILEPLDPNRVELLNWQVNTKDLQGDTSIRNFEFVLPDGGPLVDEKFVFSPQFTGETVNGITALEAMTIVDNNLLFTSDPIAKTFTIAFQTNDVRAKSYSLWFYTGPPAGTKPVRIVDYNSVSIANTLVNNPAGVTEVTIPWSEVDPNNTIALNLKGVHVVLLDTPVSSELIAGKDWFAYIGVSEFFTLLP